MQAIRGLVRAREWEILASFRGRPIAPQRGTEGSPRGARGQPWIPVGETVDSPQNPKITHQPCMVPAGHNTVDPTRATHFP